MYKGKQNRKEETLRRVAVVTIFWIAMNLGPAKMVEKKNEKYIDFYDFPENDCTSGTKR